MIVPLTYWVTNYRICIYKLGNPSGSFYAHADAAVIVTVTVKVSPEITDRADPKSTAPYNVPVVPDLVSTELMKAPAIVTVPLIE
jgi:hypothetical protein